MLTTYLLRFWRVFNRQSHSYRYQLCPQIRLKTWAPQLRKRKNLDRHASRSAIDDNGDNQGRIQGREAHPARAPLKLGKNMIF